MTDILDELFYGNLDLSLLDKKGSTYNKKLSEIVTLLEKLEDSEYAQEAERLGDAFSELDTITSRAHFIIGFRWGARIALAITSDDPNIFTPYK